VPIEALATLRRRLAALPARHAERTALIRSTAELYAVIRATLYRLLRGERRPRDTHRADLGRPRSMPLSEIERWCEIVAAMKVRTRNRKGRHLSTVRVWACSPSTASTPGGFEKMQTGRLTASTLNRHLRRLGYDQHPMLPGRLPSTSDKGLSYIEPRRASSCLLLRRRSWSSSSAIRLRPHRSGRAAFPHRLFPEVTRIRLSVASRGE